MDYYKLKDWKKHNLLSYLQNNDFDNKSFSVKSLIQEISKYKSDCYWYNYIDKHISNLLAELVKDGFLKQSYESIIMKPCEWDTTKSKKRYGSKTISIFKLK